MDAVFGDDSMSQVAALPMSYLENLSSALLLFCDNELYSYTCHFEDALRQSDFKKVEVVYLYDLGHGALWRNLSGMANSPYRNRMVQFIKEYSNPPEALSSEWLYIKE